jgi:hypothetical protein
LIRAAREMLEPVRSFWSPATTSLIPAFYTNSAPPPPHTRLASCPFQKCHPLAKSHDAVPSLSAPLLIRYLADRKKSVPDKFDGPPTITPSLLPSTQHHHHSTRTSRWWRRPAAAAGLGIASPSPSLLVSLSAARACTAFCFSLHASPAPPATRPPLYLMTLQSHNTN